MRLVLRDARVLTDFLRADNDWGAAAHAYGAEHDSLLRRHPLGGELV
jgi:hypothetical protein